MTKKIYLTVLFFMAMILTGCNTATENAPIDEAPPMPTQVEKVQLVLPTDVPEVVDECTACHTDKDRLIDTAKPEEEVIKESEGAG